MNAIGSALGGLNAARDLLNTSARQIAQQGPEPEAIVNTQIAETSFKANVATIQTADEINEAALDILA